MNRGIRRENALVHPRTHEYGARNAWQTRRTRITSVSEHRKSIQSSARVGAERYRKTSFFSGGLKSRIAPRPDALLTRRGPKRSRTHCGTLNTAASYTRAVVYNGSRRSVSRPTAHNMIYVSSDVVIIERGVFTQQCTSCEIIRVRTVLSFRERPRRRVTNTAPALVTTVPSRRFRRRTVRTFHRRAPRGTFYRKKRLEPWFENSVTEVTETFAESRLPAVVAGTIEQF